MPGAVSLQSDSTEQVLAAERDAVSDWLATLEKRLDHDERVYERVLQLRRLIGKLDTRIRLVRDIEGSPHGSEREPATLPDETPLASLRIPAKRSR